MLSVIAQDLRLGRRLLWRTPGTTTVAVLSLALGIGANTAIFSVMDALLWRPFPVSRPGDLVAFQAATPGSPWSGDDWSGLQFPYPAFERYRDAVHAFADIAAIVDLERSSPLIGGVQVTMDAATVHVAAAIVGLVLLLACSNVADPLLARGSSREHKMAVRRAIGARFAAVGKRTHDLPALPPGTGATRRDGALRPHGR